MFLGPWPLCEASLTQRLGCRPFPTQPPWGRQAKASCVYSPRSFWGLLTLQAELVKREAKPVALHAAERASCLSCVLP